MKIRNGFVSNSSSSSFIIDKSKITPEQIEQIKNHDVVGKELGIEYTDWPWEIKETETTIEGITSMDNFDMEEFLNKIGVLKDKQIIQWEHGHW